MSSFIKTQGPTVLTAVFIALILNFLIQPLANRFWKTPFDPKIITGSYIWSLSGVTQTTYGFNVVFWLTFINQGQTPGSIGNLKLRICFPKGDWVLDPLFEVDGKTYLQMFSERKWDSSYKKQPFNPIYLPGNSQITKSLLFMPKPRNFNPKFVEPGNHRVILNSRRLMGLFKEVWTGKLNIGQGEFDRWKKKGEQIRTLELPAIEPLTLSECPKRS